MSLKISKWGEKSTANGKKKKNFWKWIFFALVDEIGSGRKRMWFNDCVVITFHSAVKPELMAYKKCGSVTTCSMEFRPKLSHSFLMSLFRLLRTCYKWIRIKLFVMTAWNIQRCNFCPKVQAQIGKLF